MPDSMSPRRPLIGLTTYRKMAAQATPIPLFALMPSYPEAVLAAGGIPLLIPPNLDEPALQTVLEKLDGLILTGGGDVAAEHYGSRNPDLIHDVDPDRDRTELFLARRAADMGKPLLAICRGHQVLNVALGGTLYEDVAQLMPGSIKHDYFGEHPRNYLAHTIAIAPGSCLADCLRPSADVRVNSLHHQGLRDLAPRLRPTAVAPDGLIEAVEVKDHPFGIGVQWHPENLVGDDPAMLALFRGLVEAAG